MQKNESGDIGGWKHRDIHGVCTWRTGPVVLLLSRAYEVLPRDYERAKEFCGGEMGDFKGIRLL